MGPKCNEPTDRYEGLTYNMDTLLQYLYRQCNSILINKITWEQHPLVCGRGIALVASCSGPLKCTPSPPLCTQLNQESVISLNLDHKVQILIPV